MERRRPGQRRELGPYRRHELLTGKIMYPMLGYSGYGDGHGTNLEDFISEEMRLDWVDNRTALLAFWRSDESCFEFPDSLPWLFISHRDHALPWAARVFDKGGGDPKRKRRARRAVKEARPIVQRSEI
jgi:hypothetical protein